MICSFLRRWPLVPTVMLTVLLYGLLVGPVRAEGGDDDKDKKKNTGQVVYTAASLRASLLYGHPDAAVPQGEQVADGRRIVPLAFGLSAVVPGLGQAYNRQWVKAAVVLGAEVALIAGYTTWQNKGNDGRDAYIAFAHDLWSPLRYAQWLNEYIVYLETEFNTPIAASPIDLTDMIRGIDYQHPDSWTDGQRVLVRSLFNAIRSIEDNVYHPETGASFSHKLPYFGEQQYYELVGKYFQFAPGWADYAVAFKDANGTITWVDAQGNFIQPIDPEMTGVDGSKPNVTDTFFRYADDHGRANDYLRRASRLSMFFVINHLLAAVDAAVFAKIHNNRLEASVQMSQSLSGEVQPVATLRVKM